MMSDKSTAPPPEEALVEVSLCCLSNLPLSLIRNQSVDNPSVFTAEVSVSTYDSQRKKKRLQGVLRKSFQVTDVKIDQGGGGDPTDDRTAWLEVKCSPKADGKPNTLLIRTPYPPLPATEDDDEPNKEEIAIFLGLKILESDVGGANKIALCDRPNLVKRSVNDILNKKLLTCFLPCQLCQAAVSLSVSSSDPAGYRHRLEAFVGHLPEGKQVQQLMNSGNEISVFSHLFRKYNAINYSKRLDSFFRAYNVEVTCEEDPTIDCATPQGREDAIRALLRRWEGQEEILVHSTCLENAGPELSDVAPLDRVLAFVNFNQLNYTKADCEQWVARAKLEADSGTGPGLDGIFERFGNLPEPNPRSYLFVDTRYPPKPDGDDWKSPLLTDRGLPIELNENLGNFSGANSPDRRSPIGLAKKTPPKTPNESPESAIRVDKVAAAGDVLGTDDAQKPSDDSRPAINTNRTPRADDEEEEGPMSPIQKLAASLSNPTSPIPESGGSISPSSMIIPTDGSTATVNKPPSAAAAPSSGKKSVTVVVAKNLSAELEPEGTKPSQSATSAHSGRGVQGMTKRKEVLRDSPIVELDEGLSVVNTTTVVSAGGSHDVNSEGTSKVIPVATSGVETVPAAAMVEPPVAPRGSDNFKPSSESVDTLPVTAAGSIEVGALHHQKTPPSPAPASFGNTSVEIEGATRNLAQEAYDRRSAAKKGTLRSPDPKTLGQRDTTGSDGMSATQRRYPLPHLVGPMPLGDPRSWTCGNCRHVTCGNFCHVCGTAGVTLQKWSNLSDPSPSRSSRW